MARRRLRPLMGAGRRRLGVHLRSHAVDSWAVVFVRGRSFPFVLVRFRSRACVSVGGRPPSLVGARLHPCVVGFVGGRSHSVWWCGWILAAVRDVVAGGVVGMVHRGASLSFVVE